MTEQELAWCKARMSGNEPEVVVQFCVQEKKAREENARLEARREELRRTMPEREAREEAQRKAWRTDRNRTVALSAVICRYGDWRAALLKDLDVEHRVGAQVGSPDLARISNITATLAGITHEVTLQEQAFADAEVQPIGCDDEIVRRVSRCLNVWAGGRERELATRVMYPAKQGASCDMPELQPYLAVFDR